MSTAVDTATEIRPFQVEFGEEQIDDLRRRVAATRWPSRELVDDRSQGVQLSTLKALAEYWTNEYDFRRVDSVTLYWVTATGPLRRVVLGGRPGRRARRRPRSACCVGPGRVHHLPGGDLPRAAQLGREGLRDSQLLQRSRTGRALRGLGGAATVRRRLRAALRLLR